MMCSNDSFHDLTFILGKGNIRTVSSNTEKSFYYGWKNRIGFGKRKKEGSQCHKGRNRQPKHVRCVRVWRSSYSSVTIRTNFKRNLNQETRVPGTRHPVSPILSSTKRESLKNSEKQWLNGRTRVLLQNLIVYPLSKESVHRLEHR